ncbi:MAG: ATP-dependent Clp protease proteolytic subunit, partial [Bdellovibrio sp.]|nr:ATP-dependent Clp protease proteolytic subunit [Bdellovibrio sp.]
MAIQVPNDVYSRLFKDRILMLGSVVTDEVANALIAQMLYLESENPNQDIHLY